MDMKIYRCFIASPSDTNNERNICDKVFDEINKILGKEHNFRIESLKWENDVRPSFGLDGQDVINTQIGNDFDLFVGIMYKKFGSPTTTAGSGTEEEFNNVYERYSKNDSSIEIMFYFNNESPANLSDIDPTELANVNTFKKKVSSCGGLYCEYNGCGDFEEKIRTHFNNLFINKYKISDKPNLTSKNEITQIFEKRLSDSLSMFEGQPIIWVDPILSKTNEIAQNPDENYDNRIDVDGLIDNPQSYIISAPPQFGLTSLAHYLVLNAWKKNKLWIYIDAHTTKAHKIQNSVKNESELLKQNVTDVQCIILDSWSVSKSDSFKKLRNLSDSHKDIPIIVMQTIDDAKFITEKQEEITINRQFVLLYLLALPRTQLRKVVAEYNKVKSIAEEDVLLTKVVSDLEVLNIHRTPQNCLTLLRVAEKHFDESPVNRTKMLEMVLFVLFDLGELPTYKIKPDVKDCEYVLGRFCEKLIRSDNYTFTRKYFVDELNLFCKEKLIDLEVEVVFDVLFANNIIAHNETAFFRSSFWIFYFAAKRMHSDKDFSDYIFNSKKYLNFPEIIEFYTGIDRNRSDALSILKNDIKQTCDLVFTKIGMPDNINPFLHAHWKPTEEHIEKMQAEIGENVLNSRLPDDVKDRYADKNYNQIKPYNQQIIIQTIFEEYSLHNLMQEIKATSRALRNSDYADSEVKKELLQEILRSWLQLSKVLFALAPLLATRGNAGFGGANFTLRGDFGNSFEERIRAIIFSNPTNVVGLFRDDIYSGKIGPLLYNRFEQETNPLSKHQIALLIIFGRPREWRQIIDKYIVSLPKDSFFLYDIVNSLRAQYRFAFVNESELREIGVMIKKGLAKHEFGAKNWIEKIKLIPNSNLPKREENNENN
ncbi:hypothetical protein FACS189421_07450 [Bacteroidia bacterium]|nr:hypothetical protein FACS189421_07450 [Bacteroidia bacterium]GHT45653.1 hypothetical protein FACS189440_02060 [Bacteroidia bacterium]